MLVCPDIVPRYAAEVSGQTISTITGQVPATLRNPNLRNDVGAPNDSPGVDLECLVHMRQLELTAIYGMMTASANHCCAMSIAFGEGSDRKTTARLFTGREQQT